MSDRAAASPLLLIGVDSASLARLESDAAAGRMPNLARLMARGFTVPVRNRLHGFHANSWMRLVEGVDVSPWYFAKYWRPASMGFGHARDGGVEPRRPFWADLVDAGRKVAVIDVPQTADGSAWGADVFVKGWQKTNDQRLTVRPADLADADGARLGRPLLGADPYHPPTADGLEAIRDEVLRATQAAAGLGARILAERRPDCLVLVFAAPHRAGHYLWDLSQLDAGALPAAQRERLEGAHAAIHAGLDAAIGTLLAATGDQATVALFSPYGMEPANGWSYHFAAMMRQLVLPPAAAGQPTLAGRLRASLPGSLVRNAMAQLPEAVADRVVGLASPLLTAWRHTPVLTLPGEPEGYVRLNLRGREREGIVDPAEAPALLEAIATALREIRTLGSDEPIIGEIQDTDALVGRDHPDRPHLPDLVVLFRTDLAAREVDGVWRAGHGELRWTRGAPYPSGRSGNHAADGFCIAAGPGIVPGRGNEVRDSIDLTATFQAMAGIPVAARMDGRPIAPLLPRPS
ncbi:MAG: alkaline phosphatase family protein [Geminicoccaceae bacterium]